MHTVELLEEAVRVAARLGFKVRQEWLDGGGGGCEFAGQRWIFIDLAAAANEQLAQVAQALRTEPACQTAEMSQALRKMVARKQAA